MPEERDVPGRSGLREDGILLTPEARGWQGRRGPQGGDRSDSIPGNPGLLPRVPTQVHEAAARVFLEVSWRLVVFLEALEENRRACVAAEGPPLPRGCPDPACHVPLARLAPYSAGPGSVLGVSKGQRQPSVLLPRARCGAADVQSRFFSDPRGSHVEECGRAERVETPRLS